MLTVYFRQAAKAIRIAELIHCAIPYPLLLVSAQSQTVSLSCSHKRWSQAEAGKVVIEDVHRTRPFQLDSLETQETLFLASLALSAMPTNNLYRLYQGWIDRLIGLEAASITGVYNLPDSAERSAILREGLETHAQLLHDLSTLRNQATKEKQINRRVELNMTIKRLEGKLADIAHSLQHEVLFAHQPKIMRRFAEECPECSFGQQLADQLPWFHHEIVQQPVRQLPTIE